MKTLDFSLENSKTLNTQKTEKTSTTSNNTISNTHIDTQENNHNITTIISLLKENMKFEPFFIC